MTNMFNCPEFHSSRSNFLQNPYFSEMFPKYFLQCMKYSNLKLFETGICFSFLQNKQRNRYWVFFLGNVYNVFKKKDLDFFSARHLHLILDRQWATPHKIVSWYNEIAKSTIMITVSCQNQGWLCIHWTMGPNYFWRRIWIFSFFSFTFVKIICNFLHHKFEWLPWKLFKGETIQGRKLFAEIR